MITTSLLNPHLPLPYLHKSHKLHKPNPRTHHAPSPRMSLQPPPSQDLLTSITNLLWGKSLPPQLLISTVRTAWSTTWQLMMKQLAPSDPSGSYTRPASKFRATLTSYPVSRQKPNSLHLYVGLPCPWAHRTLIVRALKGVEDLVEVSIASPSLDGSWEFRQTSGGQSEGRYLPGVDKANGCRNMKEVYRRHPGGYDGRSTVPMLWDVEKGEILCNESYDIIEFFNGLESDSELDLAPVELKGRIEEWNRVIYTNVNNGVYRCGFAQSQEAYDIAVNGLFRTLDTINNHLSSSRYLCGNVLTLADVCLFTTLVRFDLVYNVLFKCTTKKVMEYPNLHAYLRDIYQIPKVADTCNFEAIMDGYYRILFPLNPGSIQPAMPSGCDHNSLSEPHNRESLSTVDKRLEVQVS